MDGGDDGIQMESVDAGTLHAHMRDVTATGNDKYGVNLISGPGRSPRSCMLISTFFQFRFQTT